MQDNNEHMTRRDAMKRYAVAFEKSQQLKSVLAGKVAGDLNFNEMAQYYNALQQERDAALFIIERFGDR